MSERLVPLGKIVTTHGVGGWLKLNPYNPETALLTAGREVIVRRGGSRSVHVVEASRRQRSQIVFKLRGVDDITHAQELIGATLSVPESALAPLPPGEYYHFQVIGLEVFDVEGRRIGVVKEARHSPGGELYVIAGPQKEYLIPAVKEIVEKVDFAAGRLIIRPPEGLLDL
ncbi:MAG TPA: ribosome maturation factor RimM [candidate division Zixibacteria bacterium]|nr:ribosome maturation factor RimM [candidate division Zixibacteria bacterium]